MTEDKSLLSKTFQNKISALKNKKNRDKEACFVVEGKRSFLQIQQYGKFKLKYLLLIEKDKDVLSSINNKVTVLFVTKEVFQRLSSLKHSKDVLSVFEMPKPQNTKTNINKNEYALLLDNIQDPGNMGTIIRTAVWFGLETIYLYGNCVDIFNPKVIQASAGAIGGIGIKHITQEDIEREKPVLCALDLGKEKMTQKHLQSPKIFVLGNEGNGISKEIEPYIQQAVSIDGKQGLESLNVASATSILCHEIFKQQSKT